MSSVRYFSPITGKEITESPRLLLAGREVPDFRTIGSAAVVDDEYGTADPYPKDEAREARLETFAREVILPLVPELQRGPCTILDAGCGTGDWISAILKSAPGPHRVHLAEYSPSALQTCLLRHPTVESACLFDANCPPFEPEAFDVIFAINVFEHIKAPVLFLEGLLKAAKPNGVIIMTTPSRYRLKNIIKAALGRRGNLIHPLHMTEYTVGQVREMARFVGGRVDATAGTAMADPEEKYYRLTALLSHSAQWVLGRVLKSHHLLHATVYYRITKAAR